MKLELSSWTHHLNQLLYSYFYFCKKEKRSVDIVRNSAIKFNGAVLHIDNKTAFFDYSDDTKCIDTPEKFDYYFKRSLLPEDKKANIYPLNFNVPMSYKSHWLLTNLKSDFLFDKSNRTEVIRALDLFSLFTNSSHSVLDIKRYPKQVIDYGGNIIFHTRLWNPDNHQDEDEKERRRNQNDFRINACRIIKNTFKNASVGLSADDLSKQLAPDLILDSRHSDKNSYFNMLNNYDICVADDGLKDTPGWKIGEYLLFGKSVITTPINVVIDKFEEHINYEKLTTRNSFEELPEKIEYLLNGKKYLEMGANNLKWSEEHLHPKNYIQRILSIVKTID
ncbi:glycosyltransferase [Flavobacterium sp. 1355]|uniref:glycosyltransferase n=1 Tax=Flavobacterium sp. 1355 TaxID=2806571 RepID=UPI001AE72884|nr:glycosyltransferase [Flavobacterium sp. 1355]MBP1223997.1 glycosyltransferase involved in cell wall biosynthesis [Flavobacterium sp. 1355]